MRRSSPEPGVPDSTACRSGSGRARFRPPHPGGVPGCGQAEDAPAADSVERGSAVVEFILLSLLLMVPLVYFIITVGQIQGGSFAVVGAADQAAKIYVSRPDAASARAAAEQAVLLALADYGHAGRNASIDTRCEPSDCMAAGSAVTVTVHLTVALPFVPFSDALRLNVGHLTASATQTVGRFR